MESEGNSNSMDLRVASFSCYLKPHESELNVFGIDKFSGMETGYQDVLPKDAPFDLHQIKPSMFTARTPSISSEASSWNNSQSMLLQRNIVQVKQSGKAFGKRFFHGFRCASPCLTKKAVHVNESYGDQFAFPVLNPAMESLTAKRKQFEEEDRVEEAPRKSLEVFGSGTMNKGEIVKNLERKMSILTWDAIPKANDELVSMTYESSTICDDMASEASSDLFEIENISRTGSFTSCVMSPSTQYAPSEASIEWSIVTASAAEFSSVYSYDEKNTVYATSTSRTTAKNETGMGKEAQKSRPGLLGCKSQKSVKVAESVHRTTDKSKH